MCVYDNICCWSNHVIDREQIISKFVSIVVDAVSSRTRGLYPTAGITVFYCRFDLITNRVTIVIIISRIYG